jgi:hypothetical protein
MSSAENAPFFIVGSERSGTTLLMVMLGAHSRLSVPEVTWYYPRFRAYLHTYGDLQAQGNFRTLVSEMALGLKTPCFGLPVNPRTWIDQLIGRAEAPTFAGAFRALLAYHAEAEGKPRWGEKTPHNLFYVREILQDFPDAKFLNLVRDGRDVAVEQLRSAFGPRNAYTAARIWKRTQEAAAAARKSVPASQWLDVRYEDLAADPGGILRGVTAFLGEAYEPALLEYHRGTIAERRGRTRDHRPLGGPVSTEFTGHYRRYLSAYDQEVFAAVAGEALREAGYGDIAPPAAISPADAALWDEHDQRIRAATLDAPEGHLVYESYNDWLADQREERRRRGIWHGETPANGPDWEAEFLSGQRAPLYWKRRFAIPRRYEGESLVL